jgi:hypothetical protein
MQVPLSGPEITKKETDLISEVLGTPYLSMGPKISERFQFRNSNLPLPATQGRLRVTLRYGLRPTLRPALRAGSG